MNVVRLIMLSGFALLTGCAPSDTALFVTKTSISILDADTTPQNISIAYNRDEGYFGPRYDSGAVPPVLASIRSDGDIISPQVQQLYATGNAAEIVAGVDPASVTVDTSKMTGDKKLMFFGTTTTTGFKLDVGADLTPRGLLFGFRRKEVSVIPLATKAKPKSGTGTVDAYPSVIAAIDTRGASKREGNALTLDLDNRQYFATGVAAEKMAVSLRGEFLERAKEDVGGIGLAQKLAASEILSCYTGVPVTNRPEVWKDADTKGLFFDKPGESKTLVKMLSAYKLAVNQDGNVVDVDRLARIDRRYANRILTPNIALPGRLDAIKSHREKTCALSKANQAS